MPYQTALTIGAPVRPGAEGELDALLRTMGDGVANGSVLDFGALTGVHFARVFVVPAETDETGKALPAYLFLLVDADVTKSRILGELAQSDGSTRSSATARATRAAAGSPTSAGTS